MMALARVSRPSRHEVDAIADPCARASGWPGWIAALLLWAWAGIAGAQPLIVMSDDSAPYREVVAELRTGLAAVPGARLQPEVILLPGLAGIEESAFRDHGLVISVGLAAARDAVSRATSMSSPPRILCLLIPRQGFEELVPPGSRASDLGISAVYIDQPLSRQLDLVRLALPGKDHIGVIVGPSSAALGVELRAAAAQRGLGINLTEVADSAGLYAALRTVMPASDLLLLLPDPVATNPDTIYGLLMTSYRAQLPLFGFSEGLARAGALVSLFSSSAQQGRQGAEIARQLIAADGGVPAVQFPIYYTVRVNQSVARSLGLRIEDEEVLAEALRTNASDPAVQPPDEP